MCDPSRHIIRKDLARQNSSIHLIASENFVSEAVLEAAGSVMTNKYAEGYPGRRYYGGCEFVDTAERLAIDRAKELPRCFSNTLPVTEVASVVVGDPNWFVRRWWRLDSLLCEKCGDVDGLFR